MQLHEVHGAVPAYDLMVSGGLASVSDADDIAIVCDGTAVEVFVAGTSIGSGTLTAILTGTAGSVDFAVSRGDSIDSIEMFPRDVTSILPNELV